MFAFRQQLKGIVRGVRIVGQTELKAYDVLFELCLILRLTPLMHLGFECLGSLSRGIPHEDPPREAGQQVLQFPGDD